jgi:hypothetical protein
MQSLFPHYSERRVRLFYIISWSIPNPLRAFLLDTALPLGGLKIIAVELVTGHANENCTSIKEKLALESSSPISKLIYIVHTIQKGN